ncbi:MAG: non-canonical purine NTP pyrophosphatase, RdgB/HAM1 family [Flavobacteriaceae bacterium]|nr:non-canonical purine NTP pyrophosphatase, RdgB/HAM1 family [Flavobacteriaceae bacterium]
MKELIFATHNQNKVKEVKAVIKKYNIKSLSDVDYHAEIEETAKTFEGNALLKAKQIYAVFKTPVFADDSGLEVAALDGAPGIYSARYAGEEKNHKKNNAKLLDALAQTTNRKAQFKTAIAYVDANKEICFEGIVMGEIATALSGTGGFGYDPLFIPEGYRQTFGALPRAIKLKISHRSRAITALFKYLKSLT